MGILDNLFTLTENESDLLFAIIWIFPIIIFVVFGQRIQLYMTSIELEKKIRKIKSLEHQINNDLLIFVRSYGNISSIQIDQLIDYFVILPNNMDPNGIVPKIKHVIRSRENYINCTIRSIFPNCDKIVIKKIQSLFEIMTLLKSLYKNVNHILLTAKKQHNYPLILPLQLNLPFIMEEAFALKESIDPIKKGDPIGDGIGPLVVNNMMQNTVKHHDIDQTIWSMSTYNDKKLYFVKAEGPSPTTGKLGDAVELLIAQYTPNLIIMVDAALKLEGEKTASVSCGFGAAIGGIGIDKFQIEELATKYAISIFSIVVKESIKDSMSTMTNEISEKVNYIKSLIYNTVDKNTIECKSILIIGVGNTSGID